MEVSNVRDTFEHSDGWGSMTHRYGSRYTLLHQEAVRVGYFFCTYFFAALTWDLLFVQTALRGPSRC